jgi:hypothetical protein
MVDSGRGRGASGVGLSLARTLSCQRTLPAPNHQLPGAAALFAPSQSGKMRMPRKRRTVNRRKNRKVSQAIRDRRPENKDRATRANRADKGKRSKARRNRENLATIRRANHRMANRRSPRVANHSRRARNQRPPGAGIRPRERRNPDNSRISNSQASKGTRLPATRRRTRLVRGPT